MFSNFIVIIAMLALATACPFAGLAGHQLKKRNAHTGIKFDKVSRKRATEQDVTARFVLTSRVKTLGGNAFGQGFPVGYAVDGVETPEINVIAGKTYEFEVRSACNHPFYLTTDPRGKNREPMNVGFAEPPNTADPKICAGEVVQWTPDESLIGLPIFYQCTVHDKMGWLVIVSGQTLCDRLTDENRDLLPQPNNFGLMKLLIENVIQRLLTPSAENLLFEFFNGVLPPNIDYTDPNNAEQATVLNDQLISFFGDLLECTDGSIPPYNSTRTQREIHADIPIASLEYNEFVSTVIGVAAQIGVSTDDQTTISAALNAVEIKGEICNVAEDCQESICSKYAPDADGDGQQVRVIGAIVEDAFTRVANDPLLAPFFDGTTPSGSIDFLGNAGELEALKVRFAAFLGLPGILTCVSPQFPQTDFSVADLKALHAPMPIDTAIFDAFNNHVIGAARDAGIDEADLTTIRAILDSTEPLICNQPGCSVLPGEIVLYDVTIAEKPTNHFAFGEGFAAAYVLSGTDLSAFDGVNGGLNMKVGETYAFRINSGCAHPFYVSTGTGNESPEVETGVFTRESLDNGAAPAPVGTEFCNGRENDVLFFRAGPEHVGQELFFACRNHNIMGARICVTDSGTGDCIFSDASPPPSTPCDQMVVNVIDGVGAEVQGAALTNAREMLTQVVVNTFVAGAVTAPAPLAKYFDGTQPAGSVNFVGDANGEQGQLVEDLVKWFGLKLGCSDNSIDTVYTPDEPEPNMKIVHQNMGVVEDDFNLFNTVLLANLQNVAQDAAGTQFGLINGDGNFVKKVAAFLNTTASDICVDCGDFEAPSFCEKWAAAAGETQFALISDFVTQTFVRLTADGSASRVFFDGTEPCDSRDFIGNALNQFGLVKSLSAFFGRQDLLGCSDASFPAYRGQADMGLVHKQMPITKAIYEQFVNTLAGVITDKLSVDVPDLADDLAIVAGVLFSEDFLVICNQDDCDGEGTDKTFVPKTQCGSVPALPLAPSTDSEETPSSSSSSSELSPSEETSASLMSVSTFVVAAIIAIIA